MLTTSLYSFFAALKEISKKRILPDQLQESSSKHQKKDGYLTLAEAPLNSISEKICDSISSALGGSGWKTQKVGTLGFITQRSPSILRQVEKAIGVSLRHPSSLKEPRTGLFPAVLCRALIKANVIRINASKETSTARLLSLERLTGPDLEICDLFAGIERQE